VDGTNGVRRRLRPHERIVQIMTAITEDGPLPFSELLKRMPGLTTANHVRKIVSISEDRNILKSRPSDGDLPRELTKGRPPATQYVEINRAAGCVIGLNVGRTYFAIGVADPNGHLFSTADRPPKHLKAKAREEAWEEYTKGQIVIHPRKSGVDGRVLLKLIAEETVHWLKEVEVKEQEIRGITLSLPAPVSTTESKLLTNSIERSLGNVESIERTFMDFLGKQRYSELEKVIVANDADVAARGEVRYGKGRRKRDVIAIHAAYGIGAGVISDGKVLRTGAGGGAGEVGHCMPAILRDEGSKYGLEPLKPSSPVFTCACDCPGHLEAMAGGEAIVKRLAASLDQIDPPPGKELAGMLADRDRDLSATVDALLEAISGSDPWEPGREAVLDAAHMIGGAVHTLAHLFRPEAIYLCGKLSEAGDPFLDMVEEGLKQPGSLQGYIPVVELGEARSEFKRRLTMVRGAAMTAVRGTKPLITQQYLEELDSDK
jgi:predicted NBD/HSP70 family sugar kinase